MSSNLLFIIASIPIILLGGASNFVAEIMAVVGDFFVASFVVFIASGMGLVVAITLLMPFVRRVRHNMVYRPVMPPLLTSKLSLTESDTALVNRPRLLDKLRMGMDRRFVVIAAPAGYGKTVLLHQWVRQSGRPLAFLSLDTDDNDPARLFAYILASLQSVKPDFGQTTFSMLRSAEPPASIMATLLHDLDKMSGEITLVLDNYQVIKAAEIHTLIAFLIEHMPAHMHLIIASRTEPPLPLPLFRARGQMLELQAADLRFTVDDAIAMINQKVPLTTSQIDMLVARTEGWIVGLKLALLAIQQGEDASHLIESFGGSHRYIADYFSREILRNQSESAQRFLLHTAPLDRLSGPLCDAVTGDSNGQAMLTDLDQANLFLVPLDEERRWYRYHRLFLEFLRDYLHRQEANQVPELLRRADAWIALNEPKTQPAENTRNRPTRQSRLIETGMVKAVHMAIDVSERLTDSLSERELEVLQLISQGLSNQEIGEEIAVTLNTVKAHVKSIYSKLDVHSRTQAVARARELSLI
jgi:ATP/maltotriose-dependent transcriptional regulator MalT